MQLQRLVGLLITCIGLLSGFILVAQPFWPEIRGATAVLGTLFPLCVLGGLPLFAAGEERYSSLRLCALALLVIGVAALVGIFLHALGFVPATGTLALWIVAPASLLCGLLLNYFADALESLAGKQTAAS